MADVTEIDGAYGSLKADEGYFVGQTAISDVTATEAAAEADDLVDELFADWDRSGWAPGHPTAISRAWLKVASGEYMDRIQGLNTTDAAGRGKRLRDEGRTGLLNILDAGGPMVNGERQRRASDDGEPSDRSISLRVT